MEEKIKEEEEERREVPHQIPVRNVDRKGLKNGP